MIDSLALDVAIEANVIFFTNDQELPEYTLLLRITMQDILNLQER